MKSSASELGLSLLRNVRVVMHQALCDDPNNGCEGDYHAF